MNIVVDALTSFYSKTIKYLPNFFSGLLVLIIGVIIGEIVKNLFLGIISFLKLGKVFKKTNIAKEKDIHVWINVLGELLRWVIIILFLVPTVEIWGLKRMVSILNNLLLYLPNVIVAVIIGLVGYVFSNLAYDIVNHSVKSLQQRASKTMASLAKYSILVFTSLVVLSQLGVAQDLIKILFTGVVFMLALAGGLAFGLGGKETAAKFLEDLKKNLS